MAQVLLADYYYFDLNTGNSRLTEYRRQQQVSLSDEVSIELYSPDGFHLHYNKSRVPLRKSTLLENAADVLQAVYIHNGSCRFTGHAMPVFQLEQQQFGLQQLPAGKIQLDWGSEQAEFFSLQLGYPFLRQHLHLREEDLAHLPAILNTFPVVNRLKGLLQQIVDCPLDRYYKQLFARAKVMELVAILFDHLGKIADAPASPPLAGEQLQRMHQVRDILLNNLPCSCSLIDLASQVGTNENYLKKHFRQAFGTSVHAFVLQERMSKAKEMLSSGQYSISATAAALGYKHTGHFSQVFRKYHGLLPNQFLASQAAGTHLVY